MFTANKARIISEMNKPPSSVGIILENIMKRALKGCREYTICSINKEESSVLTELGYQINKSLIRDKKYPCIDSDEYLIFEYPEYEISW